MAKHLFYSDVHLKPETLDICSKVFDFILAAAHEHDVIKSGGYVVNGGDLFDERGNIRTSCFDLLYLKRLEWKKAGIRHIDNIGNHDQEDRDGQIHPLKIFESFDWVVCTQPTLISHFNWVVIPYTKEFDSAVKEAAEAKPKVLFIHAGIQSAWRNDKSKDPDGYPINKLRSFPQVFSGHYHYRHSIDNVQYIGSPYQQSFAEKGQEKGILIYDDASGKSKFIEIPGTPKHYEVDVKFSESGKLVGGRIDNFETYDKVKCCVSGKSEFVKSLKREQIVKMIGHSNVTISRNVTDEVMSRLAIGNGKIDTIELMRKYAEFCDPSIDMGRLMSVGKEIVDATHL